MKYVSVKKEEPFYSEENDGVIQNMDVCVKSNSESCKIHIEFDGYTFTNCDIDNRPNQKEAEEKADATDRVVSATNFAMPVESFFCLLEAINELIEQNRELEGEGGDWWKKA